MTDLAQIVHPKIALLTKHGKQHIIAPILLAAFNSELVHTDKFDTDSLGTFDHKIARTLHPAQAALKKAYLACELTGCEQGLGSEGSFNSILGMGVIDEEFLAFVDVKRKVEVVAHARQTVRLGPIEARHKDELLEQLELFSSAKTGVVSELEQKWSLLIDDKWRYELSPNDILQHIHSWPVYLEPDFRAMHCPQRQDVIASAAHNLVDRLRSGCPQCETVNFVEKHASSLLAYLPCELCGQATTKIVPPSTLCENCGFTIPAKDTVISASAFYCSYCNP